MTAKRWSIRNPAPEETQAKILGDYFGAGRRARASICREHNIEHRYLTRLICAAMEEKNRRKTGI